MDLQFFARKKSLRLTTSFMKNCLDFFKKHIERFYYIIFFMKRIKF
jgi:hypothetical protein